MGDVKSSFHLKIRIKELKDSQEQSLPGAHARFCHFPGLSSKTRHYDRSIFEGLKKVQSNVCQVPHLARFIL